MSVAQALERRNLPNTVDGDRHSMAILVEIGAGGGGMALAARSVPLAAAGPCPLDLQL